MHSTHSLQVLVIAVLLSFHLRVGAGQSDPLSVISSLPVRNFGVNSDTSFNFDLSLNIPIPIVGDITVNVETNMPLRIHFLNSTVAHRPIKIPHLILPEPKPIVFDLTDLNSRPDTYNQPDPFTYDSYYAPEYNNPYYEQSPQWADDTRRNLLSRFQTTKGTKGQRRKGSKRIKYAKYSPNYSQMDPRMANFTKAFRYYHRRNRRSLAEASTQHRFDLFSVVEETLNMHGIDGRVCVCRAVCELAEMEFLIESPLHEVIEHLLRVSRAHDENGLLSDYLEAEKFGHRNFKDRKWHACSKRYSRCPFSIFERSSTKLH